MAFNQKQLIQALQNGQEAQQNKILSPLNLHIFDSVGSTNQMIWDLIEQGSPAETVVIAEQQTAGRGQWGRQWISQFGGLYLSIAIAPNITATNAPHLTLSSAWGITAALRDRHIPVLIKWPNDLILTNRKLGGILTETRVRDGKIAKAVIGIGINWTNPVPPTGINLQTFQQENLHLEPITSIENLAAIALKGILTGYQYLQNQGIEKLLTSYQKLLSNIGSFIEVDGNKGEIIGVNKAGELRVKFYPKTPITENNYINTSAWENSYSPGTISLGYELRNKN
ncbi:biotin--[acetyl-CoA-carboxylase] ligase [Oscillatoriales cyanobacterium USR001]|nr:biotin--[acetyl-CoA-carboxylase] ligase [Oscillatoriales cyanobacterium USR001]